MCPQVIIINNILILLLILIYQFVLDSSLYKTHCQPLLEIFSIFAFFFQPRILAKPRNVALCTTEQSEQFFSPQLMFSSSFKFLNIPNCRRVLFPTLHSMQAQDFISFSHVTIMPQLLCYKPTIPSKQPLTARSDLYIMV